MALATSPGPKRRCLTTRGAATPTNGGHRRDALERRRAAAGVGGAPIGIRHWPGM